MSKLFIQPNDLRIDSFKLGNKVIDSDFRADFMVALWRGGAPIGCYVQELLKYCNINTDHIAIRTSKYSGVDQANSNVVVHNLKYLVERLRKDSKVLIVDDIFDTGLSIAAVIDTLREQTSPENFPDDIRIATVYYKPTRNKTKRIPDYFIHETDRWVVFPHEIEGMDVEEICAVMGDEIGEIVMKSVYHCEK
jgi:hypoxanthine phosphoribosyltransferase